MRQASILEEGTSVGSEITMATIVSPRQAEAAPPTVGADAIPWGYWDMAKAIGVVIVGSIVAGVIALLIAEALVSSGQDYEDEPAAYAVVLVSSFIVQELLLIWAALRFGPWKYQAGLASLGLRPAARASWFFPIGVAASALAITYGYDALLWALDVDAGVAAPEEAFDNAAPFIVIAVGAVLMAPVIEEIFFRGFIFGGLRAHGGYLAAAIVSSVIFAAAHLSGYYMPPFTLIGLLFAWSYQHTGSLRPGMIAHAITNIVTVSASATMAWTG
jgi:membrane protease YdiL (CAAX protease family)